MERELHAVADIAIIAPAVFDHLVAEDGVAQRRFRMGPSNSDATAASQLPKCLASRIASRLPDVLKSRRRS
jgi:hypothetical protein